jgi:ketosteroid isomerase-like protein
MKTSIVSFSAIIFAAIFFSSCNNKPKNRTLSELKQEIMTAESDFAAMAKSSGIQAAFYAFADENAVIKRGNDSLICGKENIREFYSKPNYKNYDLQWIPDFADVSPDGNLGYTYGKYVLKIKEESGYTAEYKGVFHTVWKKQENGGWKYVWD